MGCSYPSAIESSLVLGSNACMAEKTIALERAYKVLDRWVGEDIEVALTIIYSQKLSTVTRGKLHRTIVEMFVHVAGDSYTWITPGSFGLLSEYEGQESHWIRMRDSEDRTIQIYLTVSRTEKQLDLEKLPLASGKIQ